LKKVAVSIGDLNGIGIEIALRAHNKIKKVVEPIYVISNEMLRQASDKLGIDIPNDFKIVEPNAKDFKIKPGEVSKRSGFYSFRSFIEAINLAATKKVDAILTLPINKEAWSKAGIKYKGHTDALRDIFKQDAIMMLGCPKMFVALYTEHIPLKDVAGKVNTKEFEKFLLDFNANIKELKQVAVLGLNPHAGDNGVLGDEEKHITKAIKKANKKIGFEQFIGPIVPDIAFTPNFRESFKYFIAIYHDQGLAPLKALYFDESINVSLNLPILRVSVDHGTAFDIAYKNKKLNLKSYINSVKYILKSYKRDHNLLKL